MTTMQEFTEQDWLDRLYRKANSERTVNVATSSLRVFDYFIEDQNMTRDQVIKELQGMMKESPPNVRGVCLFLDKWVAWMTKDHPDMIRHHNVKFKAKAPRTIDNYFVFIKSYLRIVCGIRLTIDDVRDYIQFPTERKTARRAIPLATLKLILNNVEPKREAMYLLLISSGMRLGEALSLTRKNFHTEETPIRISIEAEDTKTLEDRESYITSEAWEKVKPYYDKVQGDEPIFRTIDSMNLAVVREDQYFAYMRTKLGLTERYPHSVRFIVNIHAFRSYFHTKASVKHGVEYANALDGHGSYLKQYYRHTEEERAQLYRELEPELFVNSILLETDRTKDGIIKEMKRQIELLKDEQERQKQFQTFAMKQGMR